jgi:hypothetical protein
MPLENVVSNLGVVRCMVVGLLGSFLGRLDRFGHFARHRVILVRSGRLHNFQIQLSLLFYYKLAIIS